MTRSVAVAVFAILAVVLVGVWVLGSRSHGQRRDEAVRECESRLAGAHTRGDTLIALNRIPATQQMASRLIHCRDVLLASQECLHYEPAVVRLEGRLTVGAFAGRPNYDDTLQGDAPEHPFILKLDRAACVVDDTDSLKNISEIQLVVLDDSELERARNLVGQRVIAQGSLFDAITAHHHTAVLISVRRRGLTRA